MNKRETPLTRAEFIEDYTFLRANGENNAHAVARRMGMTHQALMRRIFKYKLDHTGLLETGRG